MWLPRAVGRRGQRTTQRVSRTERKGERALKQNLTFSPVPLLPSTQDSRLAQNPIAVTPYLNMPGLLMSRFSALPCQLRHFTTVAVLSWESVLSALASRKLREELPDSAVSRSRLNSERWDFGSKSCWEEKEPEDSGNSLGFQKSKRAGKTQTCLEPALMSQGLNSVDEIPIIEIFLEKTVMAHRPLSAERCFRSNTLQII